MPNPNHAASVLQRAPRWAGILAALAVLAATLAACSAASTGTAATPVPAPTAQTAATSVPPPTAQPAAQPTSQANPTREPKANTPTTRAAPTVPPTNMPPTTPSASTVMPLTTPPATTVMPPSTPPAPTVVPPTAHPPPSIPPVTAASVNPQDDLESASQRVFGLVEDLVHELGRRESATDRELRAAELLRGRFQPLGYDAEIQSFVSRNFDFTRWRRSGGQNAAVVVQSPQPTRITGLPLTTSPNDTPASGPLATLHLSEQNDLPTDGLSGKVVHVLFGDLNLGDSSVMRRLQDQVVTLADAGAAAVIFSRSEGEPTNVQFLYGAQSPVPALLLSQEDGARIQQLSSQLSSQMSNQEAEVVLSIQIEVDVLESRNVIAELPGDGDDVVIVGGHYDTVPQTETGANDNTSGIAVVLSLAEALAGQPLTFTLRFVLFGAEELGLYGSSHYVSSLSPAELDRIKAMLNFDVVGSGPRLNVYGDEGLAQRSLELAAALNVDAEAGSLPRGASSDHAPFQRQGIPVLLMFGPDISRIHTPEDRLEYVDPELLGGAFLVAHALLLSPEFVEWLR